MRIHLTGCSGAGKTTLARLLAAKYDLPVLPSAARDTFASPAFSHFDSFAALMASREEYCRFQQVVMEKQCHMEEEADSFVTDRCIDHLAFACLYRGGGRNRYDDPLTIFHLAELRKKSRSGEAFVFRLPPNRMIHAKALAEQVRTEYLVWDKCQQFDGILQWILEVHDIQHHVIEEGDLEVRVSKASRIIELG